MAVTSNNPVVVEINKNFVIRWKETNSKKTNLIGAGKYSELVGEDFANKHFEKALVSAEQKISFKLRRGLHIVFCSR